MARRALMLKKQAQAAAARRKRRRVRQTLDRLIVIVTTQGGNPRNTSGWTATLTGGPSPVTAEFDDFGVVRFPTISTLTEIEYLLRVRDANNNTVANRTIPANREYFIVRI